MSTQLHPSFVALYQVEDVLTVVVQWLPWVTLNLMAYWPVPGPSVAHKEKRRGVFDAISPFVPREIASDFFRYLAECQGFITGSVARCVLRSGVQDVSIVPFDLNIVVPKAVGSSLRHLLRDNGYFDYDRDAPRDRALSIGRMELFEKWHPGSRKRLYITFAVSRKDALHTLISSRATSDMNAITCDAVICFYPRTTFKGEGSEVFGLRPKDPGSRVSGKDVVLSSRNDHWTRSCGIYCPMTHRKTFQDSGVAQYRWSYLLDEDQSPAEVNSGYTDNLFRTEFVQWQVAPVCYNPKCPGMALYEFRRSYLDQ